MEPTASIRVRRDVHPAAVVVEPEGDVDMAQSPALRATLRDVQRTKPPCVIVNLEQVGYMDTAGLATLVEAMRTAKNQSSAMVLCGMQEKVRAIFEIAQLHQFFRIEESLDASLPTSG
ncbi:MAG: STAS domain-containing protein [Planctomycetota bacterium]